MTRTGWHDTHPDDLQLAALADGKLGGLQREQVDAHVAACLRCRRRLEDLPPTPSLGEPRLPQHPAQVVAVVMDALTKPVGGEPEPGELWRVVGPDEAMLVWVFRLFDESVRVIPCSFDVELADEYTIVLNASESHLGLPLALHTTLETELPAAVFDARVAVLNLIDHVQRVRAARQQGRPAPLEIRVGPPIVDPLDERVAFREALAGVGGKIAAAAMADPVEDAQDCSSFIEDEPRDTAAVAAPPVLDLAEFARELAFCRPHARTEAQAGPVLPTPVGPMQPILTVQEFAVRILACILPVDDPALLKQEGVIRAAGGLLRTRHDVVRVAVVATDPARTTQIFDLYDTAVQVVTAPLGVRRRPMPPRPPLPFAHAIEAALEELLPHFEALDQLLLHPAEIEFTAVATRAADDAVEKVQTAAMRFRTPEKKAGYQSVRHDDKAHIAELIESLRAGNVDELPDRIDKLVSAAS